MNITNNLTHSQMYEIGQTWHDRRIKIIKHVQKNKQNMSKKKLIQAGNLIMTLNNRIDMLSAMNAMQQMNIKPDSLFKKHYDAKQNS